MAAQPFTLSPSTLNAPKQKNIVITGGCSGIGLATASLLHNESYGNNISVLDLSPPPPSLKSLVSSPRFFYAKCNVTSWTSQRAAFAAAAAHFGGRIDAVFINAGVAEHGEQIFTDSYESGGKQGTAETLAEPDRRTIDVDIRSVGDSLKLAVYHMRQGGGGGGDAAKKGSGAGRGGNIVMTASLAGYLASAGAPLYSAAKHGVVGYLRALKSDCATVGIALSVIAPGITLTPIILGVREGQTLEDWGREMRERGVPINNAETVALAVAHLMGLGKQANGVGLLIQANKMQDVEAGIAKSRKEWMGEEMLQLFRGGRNAPLFPNKL